MDRIPVQSSNVVDIGYDQATLTLEVGFTSGSVYQYFDVPEAVYLAIMQAVSVGSFLAQNIKGVYRYMKL